LYYSGKKKRHTIKSQLIADAKTTLVLSVDQTKGCVHDFRLDKDRTGRAVSSEIQAKMDSGYQGVAEYHANSEIPYKKSKNRPLTAEQKAFILQTVTNCIFHRFSQMHTDDSFLNIICANLCFICGKKRPVCSRLQYNRRLARERIVIEHINRQIKVFKIMSERYRNRRRRHKLRMTLLCAIRNYEIINNTG